MTQPRLERPGAVYRAAIFDLDGTLLDSYEAIHDSLSDVLAHFGHAPVTLAETRRIVGNGLEALIAKVLPPGERAEAISRFRTRYRVIGPRMTKLMPGARDLLLTLARRGVPMAVASNKPAVFSRQLLDGFGLTSCFAFIGGPDLGFAPKPDPGMVLAALAALSLDPSTTLFVGDMEIDIATARAAGLPVAVLPSGSSTRAELEAALPDLLLTTLEELASLDWGQA